MKKLILALAIAALPNIANAQQSRCFPTEELETELESKYGETLLWYGLIEGKTTALINLYANQETESWTLVIRRPNDVSCVVNSGKRFGTEVPKVPEPEDF